MYFGNKIIEAVGDEITIDSMQLNKDQNYIKDG